MRTARLTWLLILCLFLLGNGKVLGDTIRTARWAGQFYPGSRADLKSELEEFLRKAQKEKIYQSPIAVIAPHAGYVYSGETAGYAYHQIKGLNFETVILLGPSHYVPIKGAVLSEADWWETPLGRVKVDLDLARKIAEKSPNFSFSEIAHRNEHSLEVQVPFLQTVLENFTIVPILINELGYCQELADAIASVVGTRRVLVIASTDLSHYHHYGKACLIDGITIKDLENFDLVTLCTHMRERKVELCGGAAVVATLLTAKALGADVVKLLKYATSLDASGKKESVVGYGAFIVFRQQGKKTAPEEGGKGMLNEKQQKVLLEIARQTIEQYITKGAVPEFKVDDPALKEKRGVFVTLHKKGMLRGCIGYIMPVEELHKAVSRMAIESSTGDPRFPPVTRDELSSIDIEISVLSVPERIKDIDEIELGKHGVIVKRGYRQGVFLPQVAEETGWTKEEFLNHLCADKAHLPADAWRDKETEIYIFSAQVFSEKKKDRNP